MARPKIDIDPKTVESMASIGCTSKEIAYVLGCSHDTIDRRFASEIETGRAKGCAKLRRLQWQCAEKGDARMLIHLGKHFIGQHDKVENTVIQSNENDIKRVEEMKQKLKSILNNE